MYIKFLSKYETPRCLISRGGCFFAVFGIAAYLHAGLRAAEGPSEAPATRQIIYLGHLLHLLVKFESFL
jgi:hypothetical protein